MSSSIPAATRHGKRDDGAVTMEKRTNGGQRVTAPTLQIMMCHFIDGKLETCPQWVAEADYVAFHTYGEMRNGKQCQGSRRESWYPTQKRGFCQSGCLKSSEINTSGWTFSVLASGTRCHHAVYSHHLPPCAENCRRSGWGCICTVLCRFHQL